MAISISPPRADRRPSATDDEDHRLIAGVVTIGTRGADRLVGTARTDRLEGRGGDDHLMGLGGADGLFGGAGADLLEGGGGADRLSGARGRDELRGGRGTDVLRGGNGRDALDGGAGADALTGGTGADVYRFSVIDGTRDLVFGFDQDDGDQLDLGALLREFGPEDRIEDFLELRDTPDGTIVAVDASGSGEAFVEVALLVDTVLTPPAPLSPVPIGPGDIAVELVDFIQVPSGAATPFVPLHDLDHAGDGSDRLFLDDIRGQIRIIQDGALLPEPFLDLSEVIGTSLDPNLGSGGVRSFAFHPDFEIAGTPGFGKFYTVTIEDPGTSASNPATPSFGWDESPVVAVDVLSEWIVDPNDPNRIDPTSEREILRVEQWRIGHSTEHIGFNPNAEPGDSDHGLLYVGIGDGGPDPVNPDPFRNGQDATNVYGTILRIDPLGADAGYSVPPDNPFVGDPDVRPEIWAYGLRNPQRFSWDTGGNGDLLIADIGEGNVEEVNLGGAGANYGWRAREGTLVLSEADQAEAFGLPSYDASFDYTYPVAQYFHSADPEVSSAITGGHVYRGSQIPALSGKYIFGDIVDGRIYYVGVDQLELGEQAPIEELTLLREGEPITLLDLVGASRADLRFGHGEDGELYVMTKQDGMIRTLAPVDPVASVPAPDQGAALAALVALPEDGHA